MLLKLGKTLQGFVFLWLLKCCKMRHVEPFFFFKLQATRLPIGPITFMRKTSMSLVYKTPVEMLVALTVEHIPLSRVANESTLRQNDLHFSYLCDEVFGSSAGYPKTVCRPLNN